MPARPGIQIKFDPQSVILPPPIQNNFPGAKASIPHRGFWPDTDATQGTASSLFIRDGFILGDFMFVWDVTEVAGVDLTPANWSIIRISTGLQDLTTFRPVMNNEVHVVAFDGQFLYMGGEFTSVDGVTQINGQDIGGLVRFDWNDGGKLDTTWNPEPFDGLGVNLDRLEVNPDKNTLYLAGPGLSHIGGSGGTVRSGIAEVSLVGAGAVTAWDANPSTAPVSVKYDSTIQKVYLGGAFVTVQGNGAHRRLVRMTTSGAGAVDATWLPDPDAVVRTILLDGSRVFTGGDFGNIGATPVVRNRAAEIDNVGEATSWNPNVTGGDVLTMKKITEETLSVSGVFKDYVLIGGSFTTIGGTGRAKIGAVDIDTAALHEWDPDPVAPVSGTHLVFGIQVKDRTAYVFGNYNGIASSLNKDISAVPFPIFTDANSKFIAKTGDDTGAGTRADPFLTITKAKDSVGGAFIYAVVLDSEEYNELIVWDAADSSLVADIGQAPTIKLGVGAILREFGARPIGRTKFSTGASPGTFYFVSKAGNDGTGTRGDAALPFLTIQASLSDGARLASDTVEITDSGTYIEDLNIGILDVTIQAADGETPVLRNVLSATGDKHIQSGGAATTLDLYGLTFDDIPDVAANNNNVVSIDGVLTVHDCSIRGGSNGMITTGAVATMFVRDCLIAYANRTSFQCGGTMDVENCYFLNNGGGSFAGSRSILATQTSKDNKILHCTFENPGYFGVNISGGVIILKNASPAGADEVGWCDFFVTESGVISGEGVGVLGDSNDSPNNTVDVHDCQFRDLGGPAVRILNQLFINTNTNIATVRNCVATRCVKGGGSHASFVGAFQFQESGFTQVENCVSMDSGNNGFDFKLDGTSASDGDMTITNCSSVGSAVDGYNLHSTTTAPPTGNTFTGCIEASSGNKSVVEDTLQQGLGHIFQFCCFQTAGTFSSTFQDDFIGTHFLTDPRLVSTVPRSENLALAANSVAVLSGDELGTVNMGFSVPTLRVSVGDVVVEGFIFDGLANSYDGVLVDPDLTDAGAVQHCTFQGLGGIGLRLNSGYLSSNNLFKNDGVGLLNSGVGSTIKQNVGQACGSAFLILGGIKLTVQNNTGHLCDFGQFDRLGATFEVLKNNLYSGNGQADYFGPNVQLNSAIENLGGGASVSSGTRLNPLFRDTEALDLRLQTLESGFFFDSPAKDLGDDGKDAGAFDIDHGVVSKTFTLVDLEANKGGGVIYRNPNHYTRKSTAIKLSEGITHGGRTYSDASAFRREHVLTWEDNTDMPSAQVTDLELIYTTGDGECQLSFDGGTIFIPVRIVRASGFEFTEIADASYSDDSLPTPISELVFRDSL